MLDGGQEGRADSVRGVWGESKERVQRLEIEWHILEVTVVRCVWD